MYKAIIFDMDGTLIDSDDVVIETWDELFKVFKPKDLKYDKEDFRRFSGPALKGSLIEMFPEYDLDFIHKEYCDRTRKYYDNYCRLFPNAKETLTKLKNDGYILGILTTKNKEMTNICLKRFGVFDLIDIVVSANDVTHYKPDTEGMDLIKKKLNLNSEDILYIGDNDIDYLTCKNSGVDCILMTMCKRVYKVQVNPICYINNYVDLYKEIKSLC